MLSLRLADQYNAAFIPNTKENVDSLQKVSNHVIFGFPSRKIVSELMKQRGFMNIDEKRVPLCDNNMIEEHFGEMDLLCLDDCVAAFMENGEQFRKFNESLWAFKLSPNKDYEEENDFEHNHKSK